MSKTVWVPIDPYQGLAVSDITSNVLRVGDAFDMSLSAYTTAGSTSAYTLQVSNSSRDDSDIPEAAWTNFQEFALGLSVSTLLPVPVGVRHIRVIRNPSNASFVLEFNKYVR